MCLKRFIRRKIDEMAVRAIGVSATQIKHFLEDAEDEPIQKSVSGATDLYLKQIERNFPNFCSSEAENEISQYVEQYAAKQGGTNIRINRISISGYRKYDTYATIQYQCSTGFNRPEGNRYETRYILDYTLKIKDNGSASAVMKCPNCGAALQHTDILQCPYCDIKIIRDTILSWDVTSIKEK